MKVRCETCGNEGPVIDDPGGTGPRHEFNPDREGVIRCKGEKPGGHGLCNSYDVTVIG